ncbi:MAG: DNA alkylation repair protein [Melioribacteraceae bacterium]|nr:DNA alkylation repair protein [Melioribacteraceae bacterium]MCF8394423.1 DNA alkylation repair protein [Melioribacteraceae bacterium]MCF8417482.1 DNA alkylation repair protein [Melioribacteraceae bacterium]
MKEISIYIQNKITAIGKPEKARWLENYIKHDIKSKGVGIPDIRMIVKKANDEFGIKEKPQSDQIKLLTDLMTQEYTEDKLSAILYLQLFWHNEYDKQKIDLVSYWFDERLITDWNVCDWLCVRILTPMIDNSPKVIISELKKWNTTKNMWKARASLVPFAQSKTMDHYKEIIGLLSVELIKREERFCKTAVGWVMREFSKIDKDFVLNFLSDNEKWTTNEVIKNANKYIKNHY